MVDFADMQLAGKAATASIDQAEQRIRLQVFESP